ncbi:hypothetical protein SE91_02210 [Bradyrhizobium sp. DOA1]|nr:hypothetical protein SE91_02210 [Bradyrhizobium sp. DOA1]
MSAPFLGKRNQSHASLKAFAYTKVNALDYTATRGTYDNFQLHTLDHHQRRACADHITVANRDRNHDAGHWRAGHKMTCLLVRAPKFSQWIAVSQDVCPATDMQVKCVTFDCKSDRHGLACNDKESASV